MPFEKLETGTQQYYLRRTEPRWRSITIGEACTLAHDRYGKDHGEWLIRQLAKAPGFEARIRANLWLRYLETGGDRHVNAA